MFSCNCLNINIDIEKNGQMLKDVPEFATRDCWYVGKLLNVNKVHPGLIRIKQEGLWSITLCLNCKVQTHAIHREKGALHVLVNSKLLNQEAINNIKSSDLVSPIFHIVVNPNAIGPENSSIDTYHSKSVDKIIRDLSDVITNYISKEQAAVEEKIKKFSDEQYELLNVLKDKAYKEQNALVRIIQNAASEDYSEYIVSPKSPKVFGDSPFNKNATSNSPSQVPFSPKRPKSANTTETDEEQKDADFREDLMFDFETDDFSESENSSYRNREIGDSDSDEIEEAEDVVNEASGVEILQGKSAGSASSIAKSCPVNIPAFSSRSKNSRSDTGNDSDDFSPRPNEQVDIAASIKALARSVHGEAIFGELPRPKFSSQI